MGLSVAPVTVWDKDLLKSCVRAIYHHSSVERYSKHMVDAGALPILTAIRKICSDDVEMCILLAGLISNVSLHPEYLEVFESDDNARNQSTDYLSTMIDDDRPQEFFKDLARDLQLREWKKIGQDFEVILDACPQNTNCRACGPYFCRGYDTGNIATETFVEKWRTFSIRSQTYEERFYAKGARFDVLTRMDEKVAEKISLERTARKLTDEIQNMSNYKALYNEIQRLVASPAVDKDDFKNSLITALKNNGLETEIRNTVFHWVRSQGSLHSRLVPRVEVTDLSYLKKAQIQWERRIQKSLNSTCGELNIPLARIRLTADRDELAEKWNELSTYDIDLSQYRPLYAPKDFLDVLFSIRDPSFKKQPDELNWEFSHIQISVKTLAQLRRMYPELAQGMPLLGVNSDMPATENFINLEAERTHIGEKVLNSNHAPIAQEFLKRGCPRALRGRIWSLVLGSIIKDNDIEYYEELKNMVLQYDIVVDKLIIMDVQLTARNDDQYFVFEDILYKTMLCFSRDSEILAPVTNDRSAGGQVIHAVLQGKPATLENTLVFPPSGVIPFHGFTMYATPFCYLYDDPCAMYYTFRAFYLRYWFRLHTVSSHEQGIIALCLLFERLLQCHEPQLWAHFKNIHIQPVKIVFKWLMRGFSGHLPPEQLLYLWDLILGYDSLEIIPLLAVAILNFRKENLLQVNIQQNVEAVLADLSSIKVMPLLQLALLRE